MAELTVLTSRQVRTVKKILTSDRAARWTARILLLVLWQLAENITPRFPTPIDTFQIIVLDFNTALIAETWSFWSNELVANLLVTMRRVIWGLILTCLIGIPIGYVMGRWWRAEATFMDMTTVGIGLPAFMWALLSIMWFGFGDLAPIFTAVVTATPSLVVHVHQGAKSIPRDLQDMSATYRVPFHTRVRNLVLPWITAATVAGMRVAFLAVWGSVILVEWFGSDEGSGVRARHWYEEAANYNGLMAWAIIILVVVMAIDRGLVERIDQAAHRWRNPVSGFGAGRGSTSRV